MSPKGAPAGNMPLIDHIREFRKRIIRATLFLLIFAAAAWFFYNEAITLLAKPICDLKAAQLAGDSSCGTLYISGVLGPLNLQIRVSLIVGAIFSSPLWLYQFWAFLAPAMHKREKRYSIGFILAATPFFAGGALLGYSILPLAIKVLFGFTPEALTNLVKFEDYLDFVLRLILLFGLAFQLPVFLVALNLAGVLTGKGILKPWRFAVFGIVLFVAAFTPTGDPVSMALLAVPLIAFYFGSGGIAVLVDNRRQKRQPPVNDDVASELE